MRSSYHEELSGALARLNEMASLVEVAIREAGDTLLNPDLAKAEKVVSEDATLDSMHEELEFRFLSLLALQAPVAGELRTIVSSIRVVFELARMGDLAAHIAKVARLRYPEHAIPPELEPNFQRMAQLSDDMMMRTVKILNKQDADAAIDMAEVDAEMDELRRQHFSNVLGEQWSGSTAQAIDVALVGRYFERFADHAVAVSRRVIYITTGESPAGEDWPNA